MTDRTFARTLSILLPITLAGCAGDSSADETDEVHQEEAQGAEGPLGGPTRADLEPVMQEGSEPERNGELPDDGDAAPTLAVVPGDDPWGNDGAGNWVRAEAPLRFDVRASNGWPGRALDPVLHVGALRLTRYDHVGVEVLRFVLADRTQAQAGVPVSLQWGDDESSAIALSDALVLPDEQTGPRGNEPTTGTTGTNGTNGTGL